MIVLTRAFGSLLPRRSRLQAASSSTSFRSSVYEYPVTNAAMVPHAAVLVQALDESFVGSLILADGQMGLGMLFPSLSLP